MALADFSGLTGLIRAYLTSEGGPTSATGADGETCTGWVDSSSSAVNAGLANGPSAPEINTAPTGSLQGPTALHVAGENGFAPGLNLSADTSWTIGVCLRSDSFGTFRNVFSSGGGAGEGSLYADSGGALSYQEASTESIGATMSTGTVYRLIFTSDASNYRLYVNGTLAWTSTMTPGGGPSILETAAYGGSGAGWDGDWWAIVVYDTTITGGDIATLDAALQEEAEGAATPQNIDLGTIATGETAYTLTSVASASSQNVDLGTVASGSVANNLGAVSTGSAQNVSLGTVASGSTANNLGIVSIVGGGLHDAFAGSGALDGYTTINASAISSVTQTGGHYSADVATNASDVTLWFHSAAGRGDYKATTFPFEIIVRNIGVETAQGNQTSPVIGASNPYVFCGIQVNADIANPEQDYRHFVVGIRGSTAVDPANASNYTIEAKTNTAGTSSVNDVGNDAITETRADLRIVGSAGKSITWQWQEPNQSGPGGTPDPNLDSWSSAHTFPGSEPAWPDTVYVGPVTYAFGTDAVPFFGTVDAIEDPLNAQTVSLGTVASGSTAHNPAVALAGVQNIDLGTVASGTAANNPSVANGPALSVQLGTIASGSTANSPTVASGPALDVQLGTIASGSVANAPTVANASSQDIALGTVASGSVANAPTVANGPALSVSLGTIASGSAANDVTTVTSGPALDVQLGTIASGATVHDLVSVGAASQEVALGTIASGSVANDVDTVSLGTPQEIQIGTVGSGSTASNPAVAIQSALSISLGTVASGSVVHDLASVGTDQDIALGTVASGSVANAPSVALQSALSVSLGTVASGATVYSLDSVARSAGEPDAAGRIVISDAGASGRIVITEAGASGRLVVTVEAA